MRNKEDLILTLFDGGIEYNFYFDRDASEDERKIGEAILNLPDILEQVKNALMNQLTEELKDTCRTELVKKVFIYVSDIYYPTGNGSSPRCSYTDSKDINMSFYTEYIVSIMKTDEGISDTERGFYCDSTLGRFNRKDKKFYEISNSMLSNCRLL